LCNSYNKAHNELKTRQRVCVFSTVTVYDILCAVKLTLFKINSDPQLEGKTESRRMSPV